jgi:hypothetical protein
MQMISFGSIIYLVYKFLIFLGAFALGVFIGREIGRDESRALRAAAKDLYHAGHWTSKDVRNKDSDILWKGLRDKGRLGQYRPKDTR